MNINELTIGQVQEIAAAAVIEVPRYREALRKSSGVLEMFPLEGVKEYYEGFPVTLGSRLVKGEGLRLVVIAKAGGGQAAVAIDLEELLSAIKKHCPTFMIR